MPALVYCSASGSHKARISAMHLGESSFVATRAEALSLYKAASRLGLRIKQRAAQRGEPLMRITLLQGKTS